MAYNPTVIAAHLDDAELKASIASLTSQVEKATEQMKGNFDDAVTHIKNKLNELGNTNLGSTKGKTKSKTVTDTEEVKKATQANKEYVASLDSVSAAKQKASGRMSIMETYNMQIELLKTRLKEVRQDIDIFNAAIGSGKKTQVEWGQRGLKQANAEAERLMQTILTLENQRSNLAGIMAPAGHSIQNYVKSLQKANPELAALNDQFKRGQSLIQNGGLEMRRMATSSREVAAAASTTSDKMDSANRTAKEYSEQVRKIAAEVRASAQWKEVDLLGNRRGTANIDGRSVPVLENVKMGITLEERIEAAIKRINEERQKGVVITQQQNEADKRAAELLGWTEQKEKARKRYISPSISVEQVSEVRRALESITGRQEKWVDSIDKTKASYIQLSRHVNHLKYMYKDLEDSGNKGGAAVIAQEIQSIEREMSKLQSRMQRPVSLASALGLSETTLDDITYKIRQLQAYKQGLSITDPKQAQEISTINAKIKELNQTLNRYNIGVKQVATANTALTRSWNYMKNRLAFYFTVGASTQFVKNLIEVRAQYEMTERSLGILVQSAERGSKIFNELSSMALVSPYTLIELSAAAKQLTAYDVAANDVVDTTRRLADMAAAVGVPIDRLTYALGQIKAYGYLNSRDARMFLNAGIPLVKKLSEHYTELEGRLVSVADVYDRMKKRAIGYNDVMQVMTEMTDEGGKFFDFQEKMAGTLKVELANLTLAWNNMLNTIGEDSQGIIAGSIRTLKELFLQWKTLSKTLTDIAVVFGLAKAWQLTLNLALGKGTTTALRNATALGTVSKEEYKNLLASRNLSRAQAELIARMNASNKVLHEAIVELNLLTEAELNAAVAGRGLGAKAMGGTLKLAGKTALTSLGAALSSLANPATAALVGVMGAIDAVQQYKNNAAEVDAVAQALAEHSKESAESIGKFVEGLRGIDATTLSVTEQEKHWTAMREEFETSSAAASVYLSRLLDIEDVGKRITLGEKFLKEIQRTRELMATWSDDVADFPQEFKVLGIGIDGLKENTEDFRRSLRETSEEGLRLTQETSGFTHAIFSFLHGVTDTVDVFTTSGLLRRWLFGDDPTTLMSDSYRFSSDVKELAENMMKQFSENRILDPKSVLESTEAYLLAYAQKTGMTEKDLQLLRIQLFNEYRDTFNNGVDGMTAKQKAEWRKLLGENLASWEYFLSLAKARHGSVFEGMTDEEIKNNTWVTEERKKALDETLEVLKKNNILAYNDVKDKVDQINNLKAIVPVIFKIMMPDPLKKSLQDAGVSPSVLNTQQDTYTGYLGDWKKEQKETAEEIENINRAQKNGVRIDQTRLEGLRAHNVELTDAIHLLGGLTDAEEKAQKASSKRAAAARKAQKEAETELQKAFKSELQLIDKVRSQYKKLIDAGVDSTTAMTMVTTQFKNSIAQINAVLKKNGITEFDITKFAGTDNPHALLELLKQQLVDALKAANVKPEEIKDLEIKVGEITVDAKVFDTKKIAEGLNRSLDKLKEEYELGIALDADPDLADMFSTYLGIPQEVLDDLPRGLSDLSKRAQDIITRILTKSGFASDKIFTLFGDESVEDWAKRLGLDEASEVVEAVKKVFEYYRDTTRKFIEDAEKDFDELIRKRGVLSDRLAEIESQRLARLRKLDEAYRKVSVSRYTDYTAPEVAEQAVDSKIRARRKAIEREASRETARVTYEAFKEDPLYTTLFEDLGSASSAALRILRDELNGLRESLTDLDPKNLKEILTQMEKIDQELVRRSPFKGFGTNIKNFFKDIGENRNTQAAAEATRKELQEATNVLTDLEKAREAARAKGKEGDADARKLDVAIERQRDKVEKLREEYDKLVDKLNVFKALKNLLTDQANAIVAFATTNIQSLGELRDYMKEMGMELPAELDGFIDGLGEASEGVNKLVSSIESGDIAGILLGVVKTVHGVWDSIASLFGMGSAKEKRINKEIAKSERRVKRLQYLYKDLQYAMEDAYGAAEAGAKRAALAEKQLELAEIQRQIRLEESRSSKKRDEDKILELKTAYKDLARDIKTSTDEIANDLLGSGRGDFAENLVSSMIDAFKSGEDYMKVFEDSFEKMVDNMIIKSIASKVVGQYLDMIWGGLEDQIAARTQEPNEVFQAAMKRYAKVEGMSDLQIAKKLAKAQGVATYEISQADIDAYRQAAKDEYDAAKARLEAAGMMTEGDIDYVMSEISKIMPELGEKLRAIIGEYYKYGQSAETQLSALQQGISGITEDTAGAIEAYLNGVSQQVYRHTELLEQIHGALIGFDMDVQTATMAQMLLQLQNSYLLMQSMASMMESWQTPSGNGIRVALIS